MPRSYDASAFIRSRARALLTLVPLLALLVSACAVRFTNNPTQTNNGVATATAGQSPDTTGESGLRPGEYSPRQMRVAYGVESLYQRGITGKGQSVVVIDSFGSPTLQQDFDAFSQHFNLPRQTLDIRAPLGTKPFDATDHDMVGWAGETTLDVETIHAMAPDAKIVVLTSPVSETEGVQGLPEFRQLEQYAIDNHLGTIFSQSWAASERTLTDAAGQAEIAKWNDFYQKAVTQQHVTIFSSSGDGGATDYCDLNATQLCHAQTTSFPTDSPWVVSVGGTTLSLQGSQVNEVAWSDSGGGFSQFYVEPSYQQLLPASAQGQFKGHRGVPDVAASADPSRGLVISYHGRLEVVGGTSASAPLWAGIMAVANQLAGHPLGYINPALYTIGTTSAAAQDFRDITSGNNSNSGAGVQGFSSVTGWDPVTGLGAPNAEKLLPDLIAAVG